MPRKKKVEEVATEPVKRKPGRPKKVVAETPVVEAATVAKKKPGRPKKVNSAPVVPVPVIEDSSFEDPEDFPVEYEEDQEPEEEAQGNGSALDKMANAITMLARAQHEDVETRPVKKLPWSKFKTRSSFNPRGKKDRGFSRRYYQNHARIWIKNCTDEEIRLLEALEPVPGGAKYINGLVSIVQIQEGPNTNVHIMYDNSTPDKILELKENFKSFGQCLQKCIDEGPSDLPVKEGGRRRVSREEEFERAYA